MFEITVEGLLAGETDVWCVRMAYGGPEDGELYFPGEGVKTCLLSYRCIRAAVLRFYFGLDSKEATVKYVCI